MRKFLLTLCLALATSGFALGQATIPPIRVLASDPSVCTTTGNPGEMKVYYNTATKQLKFCSATNTWGLIFGNASSPQITAGADGTVANAGEVRRMVYKITVTGATCAGFKTAGLNADCVIATFPAKTEITRIVVDNTAGFTCSATCTGTKTVQVGKTSGGTEYLLAKDATVIATYGLANADLGAALITSSTTPVGGGDLPSWTTTTTIRARYVSGTGNWGNGTATNVNAGSTTIYIETLLFP